MDPRSNEVQVDHSYFGWFMYSSSPMHAYFAQHTALEKAIPREARGLTNLFYWFS